MIPEDLNNKNKGFKVPDDYFRDFEDDLLSRARLKDSLPDDEGFKVNPAYWDRFEKELFEKIESKKSGRVISLYKILGPVAAAVIVIVMTVYFTRNDNFPSAQDAVASGNETESSLESDYLDFIPYSLLFEDIDAQDLEELSLTKELVDEDAILDYLYDNTDIYNVVSFENLNEN
ncbi:hypothetical protein DMZ48_09745 [Robertkochia solimangrovi]|nr:hypothetical protein DMZ48_09745 [Robertkochia solimangrovi]